MVRKTANLHTCYFAQTYSKDSKQKLTVLPMLYEIESTYVSIVILHLFGEYG